MKTTLVVVLDNVRSANNVGSFFRTADAFGVKELILCGITGNPPDREIHKTALGAELTVPWSSEKKTQDAVEKLRAKGYKIYAVEQTPDSQRLGEFTPEPDEKYALVFGNEVDGVAPHITGMCDGALEIPQVGMKKSLNVAVCGGIVLWTFFCAFSRETACAFGKEL